MRKAVIHRKTKRYCKKIKTERELVLKLKQRRGMYITKTRGRIYKQIKKRIYKNLKGKKDQ